MQRQFTQLFPQPSCNDTLGNRPTTFTMNWEIIEGFHMTSMRPCCCSKNEETVAVLGSQTNPVRVEDFSYAHPFFC